MAEPQPPSTPTRDPVTGHFLKGNPGGPGNAYCGTLEKFRTAIKNATPPERLARVWEALLREAEGGNVLAAREVLDRVFGKQAQAIVVADADGGPNALTLAMLDAIRARLVEGSGELVDTPAEVTKPNSNGHASRPDG